MCAAVLIASFCTHAVGQTSSVTYDVYHDFNWLPPAGVTVLPTVTGYAFQHVWYRDSCGNEDFKVAPLLQQPGFDGMGTDVASFVGATNIPKNGLPPVPCSFGTFNIPSVGYLNGGCLTIVSPCPSAHASACVDFTVFPFGIGTPVQGRIRSSGGAFAAAGGSRSQAYAFSSGGLTIVDATSVGTVQWAPFMDSVAGSAFAQAVRNDPIVVTATDINGRTSRRTILDIDFASDGNDMFHWANDLLSTDAQNGRFHARIIGPVATNPGEMLIEIQNGVVTNSFSIGSLGFPVPPAGTPTPFTMPLPNNLAVGYDAQAMFADPVIDTQLDFLGGGNAPAEASGGGGCGSPDFDCDGDSGTDLDIESFFRCVGGDCPEPPCASTADFDGDGDVGTDLDIEAFFRVLGGGSC